MKLFIIWVDYDGTKISQFDLQPVEATDGIIIPKEAKKRIAKIKRLERNNKNGTYLLSQIIGNEI